MACRRLFAPSVVRCSSCSSEDVERVAAAGTGSIVCWRVVEYAANALVDPVPAIIAIVELDEGPWVYTTVEGEIPQTGDQPVRVRFQAPPCGNRFPIFAVLPDRAVCTA
ncbi:OB-fold domain-containing protein [Nocardia flavorosea]|uniref:OB-fold domain-containing protein n=1 Tax=Nocardia flavorosea TaxID=53429 RepID=UPI001FDEBE80|nr:OB-fold domain-containing protein [Nocardia flavorosea]